MQSIDVIFYDGLISKPHQAQLLELDREHIMVRYQDREPKTVRFHRKQMTFIGALGQRHPVIELDNDARIEFLSTDIPTWLPIKNLGLHHKIWKLERTPSMIVMSFFVVVIFCAVFLKWGVPWMAKTVAYNLPENTLQRIGNQSEELVMTLTKPSQLDPQQQQHLQQLYKQYIAEDRPARLLFRRGQQLGANALAIPNNTIIMTDELVELAHSDQEILGVLAHEQGHLKERHSLQQALASFGFSLIYIAMTGDSSDLLNSVPVALVGANYSRDFEQAADDYALDLMAKQKLPVEHYANMLQRLSDQAGENKVNNPLMDLMSSHPATADRIQRVRDFEAQQQHQSSAQ
ncbi:M48 family metallopeptidase [Acinetobacter larvae]|uniref:Peptidase n=1 Tax=Acinetobacter larvae TaxID=1789224 RepID=A0A1B2LX36_9GAMM|nr:M48 family metallopeptidase [Acinetobacter larvae]AOA57343.1 peptidase [Acinetobacter larvae]